MVMAALMLLCFPSSASSTRLQLYNTLTHKAVRRNDEKKQAKQQGGCNVCQGACRVYMYCMCLCCEVLLFSGSDVRTI